GPLQSNADERCLEPGQNVVRAPLVDVADDRAGAAALEVQLGDVVAGRGVGGLAPATRGPSGLTWSDGASRFQQRDAGLAPVDADQYLLLQLSVSPFWFYA